MKAEIQKRINQLKFKGMAPGYRRFLSDMVPADWNEICLGKYIREYGEKTIAPNQYPVLTSARTGLMLQTDYYTNRQVTTENNVGYNVLPYGYITFRSRSDDGRFRFNENRLIPKGIISYFYPVFTFSSEVCQDFMLHLLNYSIYKRMYPYAEGTAQQVLSLTTLKHMHYCVPSLPEQRKIAAILTTQDKVIKLKEKLLTEKQRQKKHLMQQLLTGKKRLPGVVGEWQPVRLSTLCQRITRRNNIGNTNVLTISAQYGLINQSEFFSKEVAGDDKSSYFLLARNDFAYNKSYSNGYPFGAIKRLVRYDAGIVSPLYICFRVCSNSALLDYLEQYFEAGLLNHEIQAYAQEGARNHGLLNIAVDDFFNARLLLPTLAEQKAIAAILSTADREISLLQESITAEKAKKKALMQLLLTGIVRVNVNTQGCMEDNK